jgi:hypothetical protein
MTENWISGEHYNVGLSGQTISISFEISKYKKDVDLDAHVRVFQTAIRANGKTSKEYILNASTYTYSNWCHNYMSKKIIVFFF